MKAKIGNEIELNGITYKLKKPGEYRVIKAYGGNDKDTADTLRDLILICVDEPKLTQEEVEDLDGFLELGLAVFDFILENYRSFREEPYLADRTAALLKKKSKTR